MRLSKPTEILATRIENRHGGGVPDCHFVWKGMPFWVELKVTKISQVIVSPHQVAWHTSYWARGGLSFFLVKSPVQGHLTLICGKNAIDLAQKPLSEVQGSSFTDHASLWDGIYATVCGHYREVVEKL